MSDAGDRVLERLLLLFHRLRAAGVPVAMVEVIDAVEALRHLDVGDRRLVRAALRATLVKRPLDEAVFDELFDRLFAGAPLPDPDPPNIAGVEGGAPDPPIAGLLVQSVSRHGKNILIALDGGILAVHLGMTGKLLIDAETTPYTRAVITLDQGVLFYDDIRQFGRISWSEGLPRHLERLGPDALSIKADEFAVLLKLRRALRNLIRQSCAAAVQRCEQIAFEDQTQNPHDDARVIAHAAFERPEVSGILASIARPRGLLPVLPRKPDSVWSAAL